MNTTDKQRAEEIWNNRIAPTMRGQFTVNPGGIKSEIEKAQQAARAEERKAIAAWLRTDALPVHAREALGLIPVGLAAEEIEECRHHR